MENVKLIKGKTDLDYILSFNATLNNGELVHSNTETTVFTIYPVHVYAELFYHWSINHIGPVKAKLGDVTVTIPDTDDFTWREILDETAEVAYQMISDAPYAE